VKKRKKERDPHCGGGGAKITGIIIVFLFLFYCSTCIISSMPHITASTTPSSILL
jgi:hypothetical protein